MCTRTASYGRYHQLNDRNIHGKPTIRGHVLLDKLICCPMKLNYCAKFMRDISKNYFYVNFHVIQFQIAGRAVGATLKILYVLIPILAQ